MTKKENLYKLLYFKKQNLYKLLNVSEYATSKEIKLAFIKRLKEFNLMNDISKCKIRSCGNLSELNLAYQILINSDLRKKYDTDFALNFSNTFFTEQSEKNHVPIKNYKDFTKYDFSDDEQYKFVKFLEDFIEQYIALVKKSLPEYEIDKFSYFMNLYDEFYETINDENILEIKPNQLS